MGPATDFLPGACCKIEFISNGFVRLSSLAAWPCNCRFSSSNGLNAKYFWPRALKKSSMSSGACYFSQDRNSQFSLSSSCESWRIFDRSILTFLTVIYFFCSFILPVSKRNPAMRRWPRYGCSRRDNGAHVLGPRRDVSSTPPCPFRTGPQPCSIGFRLSEALQVSMKVELTVMNGRSSPAS